MPPIATAVIASSSKKTDIRIAGNDAARQEHAGKSCKARAGYIGQNDIALVGNTEVAGRVFYAAGNTATDREEMKSEP